MLRYNIRTGVKKIKTKTALTISGATLGFAGLVMAIAVPLGAHAAVSQNYTLFDSATKVSPGNASTTAIQMVSITNDVSTANDDGGVDFAVPAGVTTLSDLNNLGTEYMISQGDCGGGSPRFQVNVTTPSGPKNLFVYIGPVPNYTSCPTGWQTTGNLVTSASLVDATQLGGTFYESYSDVLAAYGAYPVTGFQLVTDAGWAVGGNQTIFADNTQINTNTYDYEPVLTSPSIASDCKNGGWQTFNNPSFSNQGLCVSWVQHNVNGNGTPAIGKPSH